MPTNHSTPHHSEDRYLTVAEVAERLRVNRQTVRNWIARGQLGAVRVGTRRVRVPQAELDRFLAPGPRERSGKSSIAGNHPEGSDRGARCASGHDARDSFCAAALLLIRIALAGEKSSAELAGALRMLAYRAEAWADQLG